MTRDRRTWLFLGLGCALLAAALILSTLGPREDAGSQGPGRAASSEMVPLQRTPDAGPAAATDGGPGAKGDGGPLGAEAEPPLPELALGPDGEPVPPEQRAEWRAPTSADLSPEAISAFTRLYQLGLPDPRGCEYRRVSLRVTRGRDCALEPVEVHAFVLPGVDPDGRRWAIAWDGLLHPVEAVGAPADPKFDVLDGLRFHQGEGHEVRALAWLEVRDMVAPDEWASVQQGLVRPVRAALLYRLGSAELAQRVWTAWLQGRHPLESGPALSNLLADWLWAGYHRGLCAHARGDRVQAGRDAARLVALKPRVAGALKSGPRCPFGRGREPDCAWFWEAAEALARDGRTRSPGSPPPADPVGARIAALAEAAIPFADLGRRLGPERSDSPDPFRELPAVGAVAELGAAAVEPLLTCLAEDDGLSRTVWTREQIPSRYFKAQNETRWRPGGRFNQQVTHEPVGTYRLCHAALQVILGCAGLPWVPTGPGTGEHERELRRAAAAAARTFWERHGREPLVPRCLAVLADDSQDPGRWREAARVLVTLPDPDWYAGPDAARLTALLDRRADALSVELFAPRQGRALWMTSISRRIEANDATALDDWAGFMLRTEPLKGFTTDVLPYFRPLLDHPEQAAARRVAEALFGRKGSAWLPLLKRRQSPWGDGLLRSPLLNVAQIKEQVLGRLGDRHPVGRYGKRSPDGTWAFEQTDWKVDGIRPERRRLRVCDLYAYQLSQLAGVPGFQTDWDQARRDAAIEEIKDFVSGPLPGRIEPPDQDRRRSRIALARLEGPASRQDVKAGRAIFSLEGLGQVSAHPLPEVPVKAWWFGPAGREHALVWQAERLERDERKQLFLGVVREHGVDMVPADEVLLDPGLGLNPPVLFADAPQVGSLLSDPSLELGPHGSTHGDGPGWIDDLEARRTSLAGGPVPVQLGVINLGLEPVEVPELLTGRQTTLDGGRHTVLAQGVELQVSFAPAGLDPSEATFDTLQPRSFASSGPPRTTRLAPLGWKIWNLDLAKLYTLSEPGWLRVQIESLPGLGEPKTGSYLEFEVFPTR